MIKSALDWLDNRTGFRGVIRAALEEPIPGGARWAYVMGSGLAFTFGLQVLTGILLAMYFSPSATDAWASVWYIQTQVTWGNVVRGLHHFGSSAMVVLLVLHMVQVFVFGAYKRPRELNWVVGVLLLFVVLGFALTGYLLPWDQKGYWATQVATGIMGTAPGLGPSLQTLLQGGTEYGNLTLTRFYALHVFVLPISLVLMLLAHLALFRRHGVTPPPKLSDKELSRVEMFWPGQIFRDTVLMAAILGVLLALSLFVGAPLDPPADPSSAYEARPEWYFLFLFQLLKYFEGPMAVVGTIIIPTLGALFLIFLPAIDRSQSRALAGRKGVTAAFFGILMAAGGLTAVAVTQDQGNPDVQARFEAQAQQAKLALAYAERGGVDTFGEVVLYKGHQLFEEKGCLGCHAVPGRATPEKKKAPELGGYLTRDYFKEFLKNPDAPKYYGGTELEAEMPAFAELGDEKLDALTEMLVEQAGVKLEPPVDAELAAKGRKVFAEEECATCHSLEAEAGDAPALAGYGSKRWLRAFIRAPGDPLHFGKLNQMPAADDLTDRELDYLVEYLHDLKNGEPGK
jgi:ubiquinol-cytochrome c reductase cytochrome b subunit